MNQTFKKSERLCHVKVIESLFDRGNLLNKSFSVYPIRVIYQNNFQSDDLPKVLFSVPKRSFKKAVERNLIKRRLKEAYRLNKVLLKSNLPSQIVFLYVAKTEIDFQKIELSMIKILNSIQLKQN